MGGNGDERNKKREERNEVKRRESRADMKVLKQR